ncbi:MAG TPA: trigger factor [Candidatus Nanoarchaeia archaeon]|nr:trigger factor [Candidatus Nanoarchaeia archaeon]
MKSEVTSKTDTKATLKIRFDQQGLAPFVKKTYDELRPRVKAAGFRPGKAPDNIVERELGAQAIQGEVVEQAVRHSYAQAVAEHELPVVAPPDVQVTKFVPYDELEFTASVEVLPKIEIADFTKFKLAKSEVKVSADEIDQVVEDLRKRMASRNKVERVAAIGDELNIDFEGSKDGQPVEGATSKGYDLVLGSNSFIPGFEEQLVGVKAAEVKDFDITFPKDYQASELADQKVHFKVTVNTISEVELPEVNAEFVATVSPHKSIDELKADIRGRIAAEKTDQAAREYEQAVLEELLKKSKYQIPSQLLEQQLERMRAELGERLASSGLDSEKYLKMTGKTVADLEKEMRPEAERRVALALILTEVAKQQKLAVSETEVDAELARLRQTYNDKEMQKELERPEVREDVYNHLLASVTIQHITAAIAK